MYHASSGALYSGRNFYRCPGNCNHRFVGELACWVVSPRGLSSTRPMLWRQAGTSSMSLVGSCTPNASAEKSLPSGYPPSLHPMLSLNGAINFPQKEYFISFICAVVLPKVSTNPIPLQSSIQLKLKHTYPANELMKTHSTEKNKQRNKK